jgi:hypothetical protein
MRRAETIMKLRDRINSDLTAAMKSRETLRLSVLRMMKSAVRNREIEARAELEDGQVIQVLSTLIKQRRDSIEQFARGGRNDLVEKESAEIPVIEAYMPAAVPDAEIESAVDDAIRETGATSAKDLGAVMKQCMARFAGRPVDGKKVNQLARQKLP